ncbi:MAG: ABC transporter ATP-binding protein [Phycisphaerae bacterium]|nr:ABC transporter ATP-binding protein [Phycisphaerae bacterium]
MKCLVGQDLNFSYDHRPILQEVSLRITPGKATVLVGPNGSGKTTLLWLLAGLLKPMDGRTGLSETNKSGQAELRAVDYRRVRIGMVFQQPTLWDHLTAEKHLEIVLSGKGLNRSERRRRIDKTLSQMRLEGFRKSQPGQLSGGERQRLAIARALVIDPQWLLLDEPLAHLDGSIRAELFDLLRETLAQARAGVLMATHNAFEAMRLADEVVILLDGHVVQAGPAEQVYRQPAGLVAAQVLGPAVEVCGDARGGVLTCKGQQMLENLDMSLAGATRMILRPEDVKFRVDPAGTSVVRRCEFVAGTYILHTEVAGIEVDAMHSDRISVGATGFLGLVRSQPN